jgi:hypothetical protein
MTELCRNCGKPIQKVCNQWYHSEGGKRFCTPIRKAEPRDTMIKEEREAGICGSHPLSR